MRTFDTLYPRRDGDSRVSRPEAIWRVFPAREFRNFANKWNDLNASTGDLPFMRSEFLILALETFGNGKEILAVCEQGSTPLAMTLLHKVRSGMWQTFQPSQLPLGAFLIRPGEAAEEIVSKLVPRLPGFALSLAVTQQDPDIAPRPATSATLETLDYINTARVMVTGSFDQYWAERGKNLRHNVKRQKTKLSADRISVRLELLKDPDEVARAIAQFGRLESLGWKAQEGTAISAENIQGRFYQHVFEIFCRMGRGRIYRYCFGDRVAAMDLCLERPGLVVILKTAYDESIKTISPATLMRYDYFQSIFNDEHLSRIEFYGKVMEWHLRWTDQVRTLYHLNCYRWAWLKQARDKLRQARD